MTDQVRFFHPQGSLTRKYRESFKEGAETQLLFTDSAVVYGYKVLTATMDEDSRGHIDTWIEKDGQLYSVDIKGRKRFTRYSEKQDTYVCLELHGAHPNNQGWLYGGKADLIAFETADAFLLAYRTRLANVASFFVSAEQVLHSSDALYKRYNRRDHEQITWVETEIIRNPWVLFAEIKKVAGQVDITEQENGDILTYERK